MSIKKNIGQTRVTPLFTSGAREILLAAGSRSGKTFLIVYFIIYLAVKFPNSRHLIARKYFAHVKGSIWADTLGKVIDICFPMLKEHIKWNNTDFYITLPNDSTVYITGLDDKERVDKILGREYFSIFLNECSEMTFDVYETVKTRLAQKCTFINKFGKEVIGKNMLFADENPTSSKHWSKILFLDKIHPETKAPVHNPERYAFGQIHPWENEENISEDYLEMLQNMSPAKKKRFYEGKFGDDNLDALWTYDIINNTRVSEPVAFKRIVVSIDPAVTATDTSDETGIMVCGICWDNELYVLEDLTGTYSMTKWAEVSVDAYNRWGADRIVGEVNQGGDLVEMNIRNVAPNIPFSQVRATKSKYVRAEPVASLYEQGKAHHVGIFADLELEMTEWQGKKGDPSPNRIDSLVWAAADLFPEIGVNSKVQGNFVNAMQGYR